MSLTYATLVTSLANLFAVPAGDASFQAVLPNVIDDAEQRLYRDLDFLATIVRDHSTALVALNRNFAYPGGNAFFVIEQLNVITPAGTTDPDAGTRVPLTPATRELCDNLYPSATGAGVPQYFAPMTQSTCIMAPFPDAAYTVEVVGTQRPTPLSNANQSTFLSTYLPYLFLAACAVFMCAFQQNFSAMGDNPQSAVSWEAHYNALKASAVVEEARKKFTAEGWSSKQPAPLATPPRT